MHFLGNIALIVATAHSSAKSYQAMAVISKLLLPRRLPIDR
jgi:hypothetical protein